MPPPFTLQKPYVISSLPQSISSFEDTYLASEVYGWTPGQKKRKRSELAVGINGEGVNLYDISATRLITSYAIPPQSNFTCPPSSSRIRISRSKVERRTYISYIGSKPRITLFHDTNDGSSQTHIKEVSKDIEGSPNPVVFIGCMVSEQNSNESDLKTKVILVKDNCEIQCYDSDNLQHEWTSPVSTLFRDSQSTPDDAKVEFAQITNLHCASQGILKNRKDILAIFSQNVLQVDFNIEILILITRSEKNPGRTLHIVSLPRQQAPTIEWTNQRSVISLLTHDLSHDIKVENSAQKVSFSLDVSAGILQQLENGILTVFNIMDSIPKKEYELNSLSANSLLKLSSTATMILTGNSISVYSPKSQSCLATVSLDLPGLANFKRQLDSCQNLSQASKLLSYFPKLGLVVAIVDSCLIGIQIEGQRDRYDRMRVCGLLIDSLGYLSGEQAQQGSDRRLSSKENKVKIQTLKYIQTVDYSNQQSWLKLLQPIEESFAKGDCTPEAFDQFMEPHLAPKTSKSAISIQFQEIEKRWAIYALSKIFTISQPDDSEPKLSITLPAFNTLKWLIQKGFMTKSNIESSLRYQTNQVHYISPGELTRNIVELDAEMELLRDLVLKTHLEADELLYIIRSLMESLGFCGTGKKLAEKNKICGHLKLPESKFREQMKIIDCEVKHDVELVESLLSPGSQIRSEALSLALSKLYVFPDEIIICALKKLYNPQTVVSLIYMLRMELVRGGWTASYLGLIDNGVNKNDTSTSDSFIILISTLMNCCIDAIGTGGWLSGEVQLMGGGLCETQKLIANLKAEVSLVLEGIEEMIYLKNILSEMVRYSDINHKELPINAKKDVSISLSISSGRYDTGLLPLGLKVEKQISTTKIGNGGEIIRRSKRDIGDRKSRKVGKYSRERINI
ncbi:hypothetical protein EV44_g2212 [Erysiphe necator]|uniref:Uncharacterized protein n=1 Tax=Uncinula necator TaxID=52586 RepID=A0A0B1P3R7_UNCNE|nr:hypothetical protein EV44_g2212 [Erysiphe necator]